MKICVLFNLINLSRSGVGNLDSSQAAVGFRDNGGRRSGFDRRQFSYSDHIPERRIGEDRRLEQDRRIYVDRRSGGDRRSGTERRNRLQRAVAADIRHLEERRIITDQRRGIDRRVFMIL